MKYIFFEYIILIEFLYIKISRNLKCFDFKLFENEEFFYTFNEKYLLIERN